MKKGFGRLILSLIAGTLALGSCQSSPSTTNEGNSQRELYQLAVDNGYQGTYEEWLASIKGKDGVSIKGIEKTASYGIVDEYTIYYSDGNTSIFRVTNGKDGIQGIQGEPGEDGHTPVITIGSNGHWIIDGADSGFSAKGEKGERGEKGEKGEAGSGVLSGTEDPTGIIGKDGDVYINTSTWDVFERVDGYWTKVGNIKGGQGQKGDSGQDGRGISSIALVYSESNVDTYQVTYTDGTTYSFTVTNGKNGEQGIQGTPGKDGHTPTITISPNGTWVIDGIDTFISVQGPKGEKGDSGRGILGIDKTGSEDNVDIYTITYTDGGQQNFAVVNGKDGIQGIQGEPGEDGHTPVIAIGSSGNWVIDGVDTGIPAQGPKGDKGEDGRGIVSIDLSSSDSNLDIYTIKYTDGSVSQFFVRNGEDGAQGIQGMKGEDGHTPVITIGENGNWIVDGVDSGFSAQGPKGDKGNDGVTPHIGENGNWYIGEEDTGIPAKGKDSYSVSPLIFEGYWYLGFVIHTNIKQSQEGRGDYWLAAYGPSGNDFLLTFANSEGGSENYMAGEAALYRYNYLKEFSGGKTLHCYTETDPNDGIFAVTFCWPLGVRAEPQDGVSIIEISLEMTEGNIDRYRIYFSNGTSSSFTVTNGRDGAQGIQGEPGEDGHTPSIWVGPNGHWFVDGVDAGIEAQGPKGADGRGISSIELTSKVGDVDTYTIVYSDGTTSTFTVTNGTAGIQGIQGEPGEDGHTPVITIGENGNWFIDGEDTTFSSRGPKGEQGDQGEKGEKGDKGDPGAQGEKGDRGEDGRSAYEIYCELYGYEGSEEQWMNDLVNGLLSTKKTYTVTFDSAGGTYVAPQSVLEGKKAVKPANPTKYGYTFVDWVDENNDHWVFNGYPITEYITLHAVWTSADTDAAFSSIYSDSSSTYGYQALANEENGSHKQGFYSKIDSCVDGLINSNSDFDPSRALSSIPLEEFNLSFDDACAIWKYWKNDHPFAYFVSTEISYTEGEFLLLTDSDYLKYETRKSYNAQIVYGVNRYISEAGRFTSDYDIAMVLHDLIIKNLSYHYDESDLPSNLPYDHNVIGAFVEGRGVCESYARTYQGLLTIMGINNIAVTGTSHSQAHIWNYIETAGEWYAIDATWDDNDKLSSHNYFFSNATDFLSSHQEETNDGLGLDKLYALPTLSSSAYGKDGIVLINDEFESNGAKYRRIGYNEVSCTFIRTNQEDVYIPEKVNYRGFDFTVSCLVGYQNGKIDFDSGYILEFNENGPNFNLHIPKTVETIVARAVESNHIKGYFVDGNNQFFASRDGVLFTKSLYTLIHYPACSERDYYPIPNETRIITDKAFSYNDCLKTVKFGKNVTTLGYLPWSYHWIDSDEDLVGAIVNVIGSGFESVGINSGYSLRLTVIVDPENNNYAEEDGFIYSKDFTTLYYVQPSMVDMETLVVKDGVKVISTGYVFASFQNLETVVLPEGLELIWMNAFSSAPALKTINFPESLREIQVYAFYHCDSLEEITLPKGLTNIGENAFAECEKLKTINFPEGSELRVIMNCAFQHDVSLTSVRLPDNLEYLGEAAFWGCTSLEEISIPSSVVELMGYTFYDCRKLRKIDFVGGCNLEYIGSNILYGTSIFAFTVPTSVNSIAEGAFNGLAEIVNCSTIEIVENVHCSKGQNDLLHICRGNDLKYVRMEDGCTIYDDGQQCVLLKYWGGEKERTFAGIDKVGFGCFAYDDNITSVSFTDTLIEISEDSFRGCQYLETVSFPSSLQKIGNYAFWFCLKLKSLILPELSGLSEIGEYAFGYCASLNSDLFLLNITRIGNNAFERCSSLKTVVFGKGLTHIGDWAFVHCINLISFTYQGSIGDFQKISLGVSWRFNCSAKVECSDGTYAS